jgi:hypothetical protein
VALALLLCAARPLRAQVATSLPSVNLAAASSQSVSISAPAPGQQSLTIVDGMVNEFPSAFSITVSWSLRTSNTTVVKLIAYFPTPSRALRNGTAYIPSSLIDVSSDGGATWTSVTGNAVSGEGSVGGSVVLYTSPVTHNKDAIGSQAVTFKVRIDLVGAPMTSAGQYSGTMYLIAVTK